MFPGEWKRGPGVVEGRFFPFLGRMAGDASRAVHDCLKLSAVNVSMTRFASLALEVKYRPSGACAGMALRAGDSHMGACEGEGSPFMSRDCKRRRFVRVLGMAGRAIALVLFRELPLMFVLVAIDAPVMWK
jgi:hypothetical protein